MKHRTIMAASALLMVLALTACSSCSGDATDVTAGYGVENESYRTGTQARGLDTSDAIDLFSDYGEERTTETSAPETTVPAETTTAAPKQQETPAERKQGGSSYTEQPQTYMVEEPDVTTWTGPVEE